VHNNNNNNNNNNKKYVLSNSESVQCKLFHLCACVVSRDPGAWDLKPPHIWNPGPQLAYSLCNFCGATMRIKVIFADFCPFSVHNLGVLWVFWRITYTKIFTPKCTSLCESTHFELSHVEIRQQVCVKGWKFTAHASFHVTQGIFVEERILLQLHLPIWNPQPLVAYSLCNFWRLSVIAGSSVALRVHADWYSVVYRVVQYLHVYYVYTQHTGTLSVIRSKTL